MSLRPFAGWMNRGVLSGTEVVEIKNSIKNLQKKYFGETFQFQLF